jgi:hypothetical protein
MRPLAISVALVLVSATILKFSWYDKLEDFPADLRLAEGRETPTESQLVAAIAAPRIPSVVIDAR